jgi:hypothetical protein
MLLTISAASGELLTIKVSPAVAMAPASLTVRATIDANADNRELEIVAESPTFFRSSRMSLDGNRAPRVSEIVFRQVPAGTYAISVSLIGARGRRAVATRSFQVIPGAGQ